VAAGGVSLQLLGAHASISDRFYRALYAALLQPALPTSTKASMLMALLFKAVKEDVSDKRAAAFVKRLLQVAAHAPSGLACGTLLIVSELLKSRAALWSAVLQPEDNGDADEVFRDDPADKLLRSKEAGAEEEEDEDEEADDEAGAVRPRTRG
jgi:ribosome biogenesis protein MAK21